MSTESDTKFRRLPTGWDFFSRAILLVMTLSGLAWGGQLHNLLNVNIYVSQFVGYMFGLAFCLIFLLTPAFRHASKILLPWYDKLLSTSSLVVGFYYAANYKEFLRATGPNFTNIILGVIALLLIIEAVRRLVGWVLVGIVVFFIFTTIFGYYLNMHAVGVSWRDWVYMLYTDESAMFGIVLKTMITIVLPFFVFGTFVNRLGGGQALVDFSLALMGRFTGGPAKVAVIASSLFGTISGSSIVNAATTGVVTIPLMKNVGYKPEFAAGVEAAASTGGTLMPPVMGLTAFLIAEFLEISYMTVVIAALVPAILYYLSLFLQTHLQAQAKGLTGLPQEKIPPLKESFLKVIPFAIPLFVIVYALMVMHVDLPRAGFLCAASALSVVLFQKNGYKKLRNLPAMLMEAGRSFLNIAAIGGGANLVIGGMILTGLAVQFSSMILAFSGGHLTLLLIFGGLSCIILGMGMPAFVGYIVLAILIAPALVEAGITPLAAHIFIMYYGVLAPITPPVCVTVYVTQTIAGSEFWATASASLRLAVGAYVLPWVFVFDNGLLIMGSPMNIIITILRSSLGILTLGVAFEGYWRQKIGMGKRVLLVVSSAGLLVPFFAANIGGLCILAIFIFYTRKAKASEAAVKLNC